MINKEINIPVFKVNQLITPIVLMVLVFFVFSNHNSSRYLNRQNNELTKKYDSLTSENIIIKKAIVKLDNVLEYQDSVSKIHESKVQILKQNNRQIQKDYEKQNNIIDNLNAVQLDSSIAKMLFRLRKN